MSEFTQYSTEQLKDLARKALADPKAPEGLSKSIIAELMERDKPVEESFGEAVTGITERRLENISETKIDCKKATAPFVFQKKYIVFVFIF